VVCLGFLHLKKMPPMPVTFFMGVVFVCFVLTVFTTKPKQKDTAMAINMSPFFFIWFLVSASYGFLVKNEAKGLVT